MQVQAQTPTHAAISSILCFSVLAKSHTSGAFGGSLSSSSTQFISITALARMLRISYFMKQYRMPRMVRAKARRTGNPITIPRCLIAMILVKVEAGRCVVRTPSCLFRRLDEVSGRMRQVSNTTCNVLVLIGTGKADRERDSV